MMRVPASSVKNSFQHPLPPSIWGVYLSLIQNFVRRFLKDYEFILLILFFVCTFQDVLVQSLQLCVYKYLEWQEKMEEDKEGDQSIVTPDVVESAHKVLQSLVDRMIKSEPEDFELDKSSIFTQGSSVGLKNRLLVQFSLTTGKL